MRLLNVYTLELRDFFESDIPPYAILSHRWEDGEVTFKDVVKRRNLDAAGWRKIRGFCEFVSGIEYDYLPVLGRKAQRLRLFNWVWIDTCCIDKRSSAELSEAINSMYNWYRHAVACYVYLNDFLCQPKAVVDHEELLRIEAFGDFRDYPESLDGSYYRGIPRSRQTDMPYGFERSAWFTRGWTLQELVAPKHVLFVDRNWQLFGSRYAMFDRLSRITGIEFDNLDSISLDGIDRFNVATKMSWAAKRHCTRSEDVAYSLMGLFRVNMPLLYGEGGKRAFERLQLEIIKQSNDESIFTWLPDDRQVDDRYYYPPGQFGILAPSPRCFLQSWKLSTFQPTTPRLPYAMTNRGLQMTTVLLPAADYATSKRVYVPLCCYEKGASVPLAMRLVCFACGVYVREVGTLADNCLQWPEESDLAAQDCFEVQTIYIIYASEPNYVRAVLSHFGLDRDTQSSVDLRSVESMVRKTFDKYSKSVNQR